MQKLVESFGLFIHDFTQSIWQLFELAYTRCQKSLNGRYTMATYECVTCGMSVNASCGSCNKPLVNGIIEKPDGSSVQVSRCPDDSDKKIKTPMCCGADMACSLV